MTLNKIYLILSHLTRFTFGIVVHTGYSCPELDQYLFEGEGSSGTSWRVAPLSMHFEIDFVWSGSESHHLMWVYPTPHSLYPQTWTAYWFYVQQQSENSVLDIYVVILSGATDTECKDSMKLSLSSRCPQPFPSLCCKHYITTCMEHRVNLLFDCGQW